MQKTALALIFLLFVTSVQSAVPVQQVDRTKRYQTLEGWGVSLAWWANIVGNFPDPTRQKYMDLVFDYQQGLGFSVVRYNIGGGENPKLKKMMQLRAQIPGYETSPGTWDWNADAGQRWVLHQAKTRGANIFEAFANSPPYWMTVSGSVTGNRDGRSNNLDKKFEPAFASYLATVVQHFKEQEGIEFRTLEPMNEPISPWWAYGNKQEGCHYDRDAQERIINLTGAALKEIKSSTQLSAPDENSIDKTLETYSSYNDSTRKQILQINTHSYNGVETKELSALTKAEGKLLWQSEYADNDTSGLTLSKRILLDMRDLRPSSWVYWQAVDNAKWGLLINNLDGTVADPKTSKKYWVMSQYTRFIRPGYTFIRSDDPNSLAAISPDGTTLVIVVTNDFILPRKATYSLSEVNLSQAVLKLYRTSASEDLAELVPIKLEGNKLNFQLPKKSVTTFLFTGLIP